MQGFMPDLASLLVWAGIVGMTAIGSIEASRPIHLVKYYRLDFDRPLDSQVERVFPEHLCDQPHNRAPISLAQLVPDKGFNNGSVQGEGLYISWYDKARQFRNYTWTMASVQCSDQWSLVTAHRITALRNSITAAMKALRRNGSSKEGGVFAWIDGDIRTRDHVEQCRSVALQENDRLSFPWQPCDSTATFICAPNNQKSR